jgi:bacillithiol biosynthesis cysteine-adding enzyme BshC
MKTVTDSTKTRTPYQTVPVASIAGATRLYSDFLSGAEQARPFFSAAFDDHEAMGRMAAELKDRSYDRVRLADAMSNLADEVDASPEARDSLRLFRDRDALVVFSGQQTGLFTGPMYAIYKALTVERWADQLSKSLGVPVVPCFWLSADDHDFDEVEWVSVPRGSDLVTMRFRPVPAPSGDPVGRVFITESMAAIIKEYAESLPDTEFKSDVFEALQSTYRTGIRYTAAFGKLWYRMFPKSRLLMISPCHRGFKQVARPLLEQALRDDEELYRLYADTSSKLEGLGYHSQVHKTPQQTFLLYQQFKRHSIHQDGSGGYVWEGAEPVARESLLARVAEHPEYFSPNVLLRPIIQNGVFPTLGVVLGPSETAYYAQIGPLHDHLKVPRPTILPRTSVTLIEKSVAKRLDRHKIELEYLHKDLDHEVARVLRASFPQDLETKFQTAEQKIEAAFEEIRPDVVGFEPTMDKPVRAASGRARRELNQVAQKAHAAHKRKEEETEAQIRRLALQLFPRGGLQERTFNIVYYWARYGPDFLNALYEDLPAGSREHLLWEL